MRSYIINNKNMKKVKLEMDFEQLQELEKMITEMPYKYAQPLLSYIVKYVKEIEDEDNKE
jgi:hypothetical protein